MKKNKCRICGGRIVAEDFGTYGRVFYIRKNGEIGRFLRRRIDEGGTNEYIYYCEACLHDYTDEFEPGWDK